MKHSFARSVFVLGIVAITVACGKDSTSPVKPSNATASSSATTGTVGTVVSPAPTFTVVDASGSAMANVSVTVAVASGGGTLTGAPTKTSAGATSVGNWTLGNTAGTNSLTVTVSGLSTPLTITVTGTPDVPTQIVVTAGGSQSAFAGAALPTPVSFKVADKFGNGVPGISVIFTVAAGGGSLAPPTTGTTDASGVATTGTWTLGKSTALQQLRAIAGSLNGTASATVTSSFLVDVRFFGPAIDPTIQAAFTLAAARIQGLIPGDISNVLPTPIDMSQCPVPVPGVILNEPIDDIIVFATVRTIDGVGGVLGSAGPCFIRVNNGVNGLTITAVMSFDVADMQNLITTNRLNDVILHEMMHTLGYGTLWADKGLVSGAATASSSFIGPQAVAACVAAGGGATNQCGGGTVPLETTGGSGTRDVHWREVATATGVGLRTELMTGFVSAAGVANPMSRISIGSMGDLGYVVNLLSGDAYTVPSTLAASLSLLREAQGMGEFTISEVLNEPIGMVDAAGRVSTFQRRP